MNTQTGNTDAQSLLQQFAGYNMKRAYMQLRDDLSETLAPFGLRIGTFSALAVVKLKPGISQTHLGRELNIKRSGVVVLVDELEQLGALERAPVEGDRRAYALRLTGKGTALWADAEAAAQHHEAQLLSDLSVEEQSMLRDLLARAARSAEANR